MLRLSREAGDKGRNAGEAKTVEIANNHVRTPAAQSSGGDQESGDDKENVHANETTRTAELGVVQDHRQDRQRQESAQMA